MPRFLSFIALLTLVATRLTLAQTLPIATHVAALVAYPTFFHGKAVLVRGEISASGDLFVLGDEGLDRVVQLASDAGSLPSGRQEIRGTFWDVGRLGQDDPRVGLALRGVLGDFGDRWPKPGELLAIDVAEVRAADPFPAPSIRAIALEPRRYLEQRVTVRGQFRGRNLYGDLSASPAVSRWDFVLRSADAALWITNVRPRGDRFNLDVNARVDTNKWLEVSGVVKQKAGLVWIDGSMVELAEAMPETTPAAAPAPVPQGPPGKVIFSVPTQDETDVDRGTTVRMQFSRDVDPETTRGRVRVSYLEAQSIERGEPPAPPLAFEASYNKGNRVLEIRFTTPLDRFRMLKVEVLEGMRTTDGSPVEPYTLTFMLGG